MPSTVDGNGNINQESEEHWDVDLTKMEIIQDNAQDLWRRGLDYLKWNKENPIVLQRMITTGKNAGDLKQIRRERPLSIKMLCYHCGINEEYLRDIRNSKNKYSDWYIVVTKLLYLIHSQNLEMAMIGEFNPIFTSKVLNLEKDDIPSGAVRVEIVQGLPALADSEDDIIGKLESDNDLWEKT